MSDELLIERVQQRDMAAFTTLYDRYAQSIYALAAHLLNRADAEEIVQEVFLRLWNRAEQFEPSRGSFRAWFTTIARHHIFDQIKQRNLEQRMVALNEIDRLLSATDPQPHVNEVVWAQQRQNAMFQARG
jgi:RNA polymerase sigma-70 factor (ECF subfamily)